MMITNNLNLDYQWLRRANYQEVLEIERMSFEFPWTYDQLLEQLRTTTVIGLIAKLEGQIVAYTVYDLRLNAIHILNLAVHPKYRRTGVGTALVAKLKTKLSPEARQSLRALVSERNLTAQLFFKSIGFTATEVLRMHFGQLGDAYAMEFRHEYS